MPSHLPLSPLAHTWILDLDGTLVEHNGYKTGDDRWLPGALKFLRSLPEEDVVIILTAREETAREKTLAFLHAHRVRFNHLLCGMPMGERILINDSKPSGLPCAHALRPERNHGLDDVSFIIDPNL